MVILKQISKSAEFSINQVEGAALHWGKLKVTGSGGHHLKIDNIKDSEGLKNKILEQASKAKT